MPQPLGAHSPLLDAVRALRTRHGRRERERFAVEGPTQLGDAVAAGWTPDAVFVTEAAAAAHAGLFAPLSAPVYAIHERAMARLSALETPPGIVSVFPIALTALEALLGTGEPALLLADVSDPGNAGTLVRSAEIFGIRNVVFARSGVDPYNAKVVRATMGGFFRARLGLADPEELLSAAGRHGYEVVAAGKHGVPLPAFSFPKRVVLAVGNERRGVAGWLPRWDREVTIPQPGGGESLNAAVAGGIIFYAFSQALSESQEPGRRLEKP